MWGVGERRKRQRGERQREETWGSTENNSVSKVLDTPVPGPKFDPSPMW